MLINSPRITSADRKHWDRLERLDERLALDPHLTTLEARGIKAIRAWRAEGEGVCSTSWGKDSVVAAHLTYLADPTIPLVWVRSDPYEMPECDLVRDAFLAAHPNARYEERVAHLRNPKRGESGYEAHNLNPDKQSQDVLSELIHERHISGVRAEESRIRAISVGHRGMVTKNTCRPIAHWQATHIFAYLAREKLPVHPAYAMSLGGTLDRRWIRVHPLCAAPPPGTAVHQHDTATWEDTYWADAIQTARALRRSEREDTA